MNEMTPEALEDVAEWLDVYDRLAERWITGDPPAIHDDEHREMLLRVVRSKGIQADLRRWAAEMRA